MQADKQQKEVLLNDLEQRAGRSGKWAALTASPATQKE
jgi:hypothetical protein